MRAAIFEGPGAVEVGERPDPVIQEPTDAIVRVMLGCVCGSDLWYYRGETPHAAGSIGHEFIGIVEQAWPPRPTSQQASDQNPSEDGSNGVRTMKPGSSAPAVTGSPATA